MASGVRDLRNPKKQKVILTGAEETLDDRLSQLPDALVVQILSLLPTTMEACRTCILSKRWQYLWTSLDSFSFDCIPWKADDSWCQFESRVLVKGDDIDLQSWISCFLFPNLKNVKIVNSSGVCLKDDLGKGYNKLFKPSEFLLRTATILEKFIIISKTRKCRRCSMNCVSPYLFQLAGKLLGCPRSSTNSKIVFQE